MMSFYRSLCSIAAAAFLSALVSFPAAAQGVIRDAEVENNLSTIATPIFKAAGLNPNTIRIILLNDDNINAFVAGGQNMFLHTGLILDAKSVGELGGVIAHESGHIAGGHLIRLRGQMERASVESVISALAGVAIGVGAGDAEAGVATVMGGSQLAQRRLLAHSRVFESSADQAALSTLDNLGYTAKPLGDFLGRLAGQEVLSEAQRSAYVMTHPLSRDRLQTVQRFIGRSTHTDDAWPEAWENAFQRSKAKILAFTRPGEAETTYRGDTSFVGRYALSIAAYRQGRIKEALDGLTVLEKQEPSNPYLPELRGQILFEQSRNDEAITAYRRALNLSPNTGLIQLALAQALLQQQNAPTAEAITLLEKARTSGGERDTAAVYRWLAVAYGRQGNEGMAKLNLAEEALLKGDRGFAMQQATRARDMLPAGPNRQRAQDLLTSAQRLKKE